MAKPEGLAAEAWAAILSHAQRLRLAATTDPIDRPLVIGCTKELVEGIAKVILEHRGEIPQTNDDFNALLTKAHKALERQPGRGLSQDEPMRSIAQGLKSIASQLPQIRNACGTGHGRARDVAVEDELVYVAVPAAMVWARWSLTRLEHLIAGSPNGLVNDLITSQISFRSGDLASRLESANLGSMEGHDQRRIGVAVAQRAMRDTFTVREDGVETCMSSTDTERWPAPYMEGIVQGLFIDPNGQATLRDWSPQAALRTLHPLSGSTHLLNRIAEALERSTLPPRDRWHQDRGAFLRALEQVSLVPQTSQNQWQRIYAYFNAQMGDLS